MKSYSSREILEILYADGWRIKSMEGSHVQLIHSTKPGKVTVPHPRKDLKTKTKQHPEAGGAKIKTPPHRG